MPTDPTKRVFTHERFTTYALAHKETGELMPLAKANRGYSHWTPGKGWRLSTGLPRVFISEHAAKIAKAHWEAGRHDAYPTLDSFGMLDGYSLNTTPVEGRKNVLEIVEVRTRFKIGPPK